MAGKLTQREFDVLHGLSLRPHGAPIRGEENKAACLSLASRGLVCDPHTMGSSLFTRITEAGRLALKESSNDAG